MGLMVITNNLEGEEMISVDEEVKISTVRETAEALTVVGKAK
jgi:hypothetical protein